MPAPRSHRRAFAWLFLGLAVVGLIWSGLSIASHLSYMARVTEAARTHLAEVTNQAAAAIDAIVVDASREVGEVASGLSAGTLTQATALARLRDGLERHPHYFGATISYAPFGFDPKRRLYSAYYAKKNGRVEFIQLDTVYDYTRAEYEWFGPAMAGGPRWTSPYYDEAARAFMVTYSAPFSSVGASASSRAPLGVVTVDISMDEIRRIIESLDLGPTGFGALVSKQGQYLAHPNAEFVLGRKTLAQVAAEQSDADRQGLALKVAKGETGIIEHRSTTTGLDAWLSFAPVRSTGWSLQSTFIKDDLPWDVTRIRQQLIDVTMALLLLGCSSTVLLLRAYTGALPRLWAASIITACLFAVGIGYLWNISLAYDSRGRGDGVQISDKATLHRMMNAYLRASAERRTDPPLYIPTGVFIESASFSAVNDLSVTGYVWQKYTVGVHDALERGFVISNASSLDVSAPYRQTDQTTEVVRWHFSGTIRQRFDHSRYPLEQEQIGFRLLHRDLNHNVVLVPDLAAYRITNPASLPGLDKGLFLAGWKLARSFFELRPRRYDTDFGLARSLAKEDFPALQFTIVIRRVFVDAFISNLTAVIIVTILLFTLLMIASTDERLIGFMQAGSGRVLNICVAMFLVIAFSHIDIRRKIAAEEVFYLEYFYFVMYVTMLWVSINSVLFAMGVRIRLIQYRDNLISKLAFWPCLLGLLFGATVVAFR